MENRWFERISDYLDGDMEADEARLFEARLEEDPELRRAVDEVRAVMERAARLPERVEPENDLWAGIAGRLELRGDGRSDPTAARPAGIEGATARSRPVTPPHRPRRHTGSRRSGRFGLAPLAAVAAALALMVISGGVGWLLRGPSGTVQPVGMDETAPRPEVRVVSPTSVGRPALGDAIHANFEESQEHLAVSILELERDLVDRGHLLDEDTRAIVLDNLQRIDEAIREARAALGDAPDDDFLRSHLARSMTRKVRLLEDAARLTHREI